MSFLYNKRDLDTIFLLKLEICKFWLHCGAASIDKFSNGAVNKKSLGTTVIEDSNVEKQMLL